MAKRGPTPCLITSTHGTVTFHVAGKKCLCRYCKAQMAKGTRCVQVSNPKTMGKGKPYCAACFAEVLDQTQIRLDELREELSSA